jgi:hypothetical protein
VDKLHQLVYVSKVIIALVVHLHQHKQNVLLVDTVVIQVELLHLVARFVHWEAIAWRLLKIQQPVHKVPMEDFQGF